MKPKTREFWEQVGAVAAIGAWLAAAIILAYAEKI